MTTSSGDFGNAARDERNVRVRQSVASTRGANGGRARARRDEILVTTFLGAVGSSARARARAGDEGRTAFEPAAPNVFTGAT